MSNSFNSSLESSINEASMFNKNTENKIIYQDDNIIITYKGIKDNYVTKDIQFLIENISNKSISIYAHEVSINNFAINTMMSITLSANKKSNQDIAILNSQLKDNDIIELSEINFELQVYEKNDYLNKTITEIHFSL